MTLRVVIADDEPVARRRLRRLLKDEADVAIAGECGDGRATIACIEAERPDVVLLDVQMPGLGGFGVVEAMGSRMPAVVFVTAFDRYALRAFEVHAVDYLLKPVAEERFREAISRVRSTLRHRDPAAMAARLEAVLREIRSAGQYLSQIPVRSGERIVLVPVSEIDWIEAADNYVALHAGSRKHLLRETMTVLERSLDPQKFVRVHRSAIVALDRVRELVPALHGNLGVVLKTGTRLTLGHTYRESLERALGRKL